MRGTVVPGRTDLSASRLARPRSAPPLHRVEGRSRSSDQSSRRKIGLKVQISRYLRGAGGRRSKEGSEEEYGEEVFVLGAENVEDREGYSFFGPRMQDGGFKPGISYNLPSSSKNHSLDLQRSYTPLLPTDLRPILRGRRSKMGGFFDLRI